MLPHETITAVINSAKEMILSHPFERAVFFEMMIKVNLFLFSQKISLKGKNDKHK